MESSCGEGVATSALTKLATVHSSSGSAATVTSDSAGSAARVGSSGVEATHDVSAGSDGAWHGRGSTCVMGRALGPLVLAASPFGVATCASEAGRADIVCAKDPEESPCESAAPTAEAEIDKHEIACAPRTTNRTASTRVEKPRRYVED